MNRVTAEDKLCCNCKFMAQARCCYCANPKQTDESLKQYTYWPFNCSLFENGIHYSRVELSKGLVRDQINILQ